MNFFNRNRKLNQSQRQIKDQKGKPRIYVACEGSVTEIIYFDAIRLHWNIATLDICRECNNAPISVVDFALRVKKQNRKDHKQYGEPLYEQIWCVFDHEGEHKHESLERAIDKARKNDLKIALSYPCFEFWYLLHFTGSTKPFRNCDDLKFELKKYITNYDKNNDYYNILNSKTNDALKNALTVRNHHNSTRSPEANSIQDNPSTKVHLLINELLRIKEERDKR